MPILSKYFGFPALCLFMVWVSQMIGLNHFVLLFTLRTVMPTFPVSSIKKL